MTEVLRRAKRVASAGDWPADLAAGSVVLDYDSRHRRRIRLSCDDGTSILLDLAKAIALREGDGLATEDGAWIAVQSAAENLAEPAAALMISRASPGIWVTDIARQRSRRIGS